MEMDLQHIFARYDLTRKQLAAFSDRFSLRQCTPEEAVFLQGNPSEMFYFVKSGELAVSRIEADGRDTVLNVLGPGEFFGEIGLLHDAPRTATVRALTHLQLYALEKQDFFELLETNASFSSFLDKVCIHRLLHDIPAFRQLDDEALGAIRRILVERRGDPGEILVREGDPADALFLLTQGRARLHHTAPDGEEVTIDRLQPGQHFGAQCLAARNQYDSTVVLEAPATLLVLDNKRFRRLVRRSPKIAFSLPERGLLDAVLPFLFNKSASLRIPELAMNRPRLMVWVMIITTLLLVIPAVVPTLLPEWLPFLHTLRVDTDPENMLPADEPSRVFHKRMKWEMDLNDLLVFGIVNDQHPNGVFNVKSLGHIYALTEFAKTLRWPDKKNPGQYVGVKSVDIMAPSTIDVVEQQGVGTVRFSWLMPDPPKTPAEALAILQRMQRYPLLDGTLVSGDGKAIMLYLPLTSKDISFRVYDALRDRIANLDGDDQFLITGLPVAEDAFGVEMFIQMAISAPLAMLVIFLMMLYFFRNLTLVISPMIVAMVTVLCTMGLLVITGNTVHIMSSMIPIFIMPVAVLDSVHILSEFSDFYPRIHDRRLTMEHVMHELFVPMLYTSLTTAVGFASLALVPIPPVQVFGIFVAFGVLLAWLLSMSFIPAYVLLIREEKLEALAAPDKRGKVRSNRGMAALLQATRRFTVAHSTGVLASTILLVAVCLYGVQRIVVNDNPVHWFTPDHSIRVADRVLNKHFAGTYMAYLALQARHDTPGTNEVFKDPRLLAWMEDLQDALLQTGIAGKSVSVADITKTVNRELQGGDERAYRIPDSEGGVAQTLLTYESSHRPQDLWHFVTPDFRTASIWTLLKSGDNRDMAAVVDAIDIFVATHPPPVSLSTGWFGLTYINLIWQNKMVTGMLFSIIGSYLAVLLMLTILLRSARWGMLAMVPLTAALVAIFGFLGLAGKPYDMPVTVLSALTIGLAVDFTIHFLFRLRHFISQTGSWEKALELVFAEPARAISRNIVIVSIGFLPLLAAPLVPYNTVGTLIATILFTSGVATMVILPALLKAGKNSFFPRQDARRTTLFGCPDALFGATVTAALFAVGLHQFEPLSGHNLYWFVPAVSVPLFVAAGKCWLLSKERERAGPLDATITR